MSLPLLNPPYFPPGDGECEGGGGEPPFALADSSTLATYTRGAIKVDSDGNLVLDALNDNTVYLLGSLAVDSNISADTANISSITGQGWNLNSDGSIDAANASFQVDTGGKVTAPQYVLGSDTFAFDGQNGDIAHGNFFEFGAGRLFLNGITTAITESAGNVRRFAGTISDLTTYLAGGGNILAIEG